MLLNENIRGRGWPLTTSQAIKLAKSERSNVTVTTREDLTGIFKVGETVTGSISGATGKILKRRLDFGQLIIDSEIEFTSGETITTDNASIEIVSSSFEYNSVWQYVDGDGLPADIDPSVGPGAQLSIKTYMDRYIEENEELKQIIVIKPDAVSAIFEQYQDAQRGT